MAFVGHVFVPPPHVSERARRLNAELQKTIAEFQRREPATSAHDVRHALLLARRGLEAGRPARVAAVAGAAAVASMLGLMFSLRGARGEASEPWGR
jgi:hypothetical protein